MTALLKDFGNRAIRQPVLLFGAGNLIFLASFPNISTAWQIAVNGVVLLLQKMYSTSTANIADEKANSYNQAVSDIAQLPPEAPAMRVIPPPPLPGDVTITLGDPAP